MGLFNKRSDHEGLDDEALEYFRSNNDMIIDSRKWILVIIVGVFLAIMLGIAYGFISYTIDLHFSLILIALGYLLSYVLKKITGFGSKALGIVALVCYLILVFVSLGSVFAIAFSDTLGGSFIKYLFDPFIWRLMFESLINVSSISTFIIYAIGGVATFQYASR